jgi:hypothetical protein
MVMHSQSDGMWTHVHKYDECIRLEMACVSCMSCMSCKHASTCMHSVACKNTYTFCSDKYVVSSQQQMGISDYLYSLLTSPGEEGTYTVCLCACLCVSMCVFVCVFVCVCV